MHKPLEAELAQRAHRIIKHRGFVTSTSSTSHVRVGKLAITLWTDNDGSKALSVWHGSVLVYTERDGKPVLDSQHFIDRIHMTVMELRRVMILDDLSSIADAHSSSPDGLVDV